MDDLSTPPETQRFSFTGSGKEYFRIWIVNRMLTVATLGIYSAWAKVRRLQYFDRNTRLAGAVFDFHGDPKAILKGRVLAVALLVAYQYAFGFSLAAGLTVIGVLLAALPFLMRSALRFRLRNTSYRGLPFDFTGTVGRAYPAYLPPLLTFLLPGALVALDPSGKSTLAAFALYLGWPLMHGAMKRYQHQHLRYGSEQSTFTVPARRFVGPYLAALGLALAGLACVSIAIGVAIFLLAGGANQQPGIAAVVLPVLAAVLSGYLTYLLAGPYMQVRIANLVWSNTTFRGMTIASDLRAWQFVKLQTVNVLLTLLTLGLYRPFAVVRVYEYRLAHLALHTQDSFESMAAGSARRRGNAAGDGVADFLGVDLSW